MVNNQLFCGHRHIDNVCQRRRPIKYMDIKPFLFQRTHRGEALLFIGATSAHPNFDAIQFPLTLGFAKGIDNPTKGLFHVGEIRNGPTHNNVFEYWGENKFYQ